MGKGNIGEETKRKVRESREGSKETYERGQMGIRGTIGNFPSFLRFYNSDWDIQMRMYEYYEERSGRGRVWIPDPTDFWEKEDWIIQEDEK